MSCGNRSRSSVKPRVSAVRRHLRLRSEVATKDQLISLPGELRDGQRQNGFLQPAKSAPGRTRKPRIPAGRTGFGAEPTTGRWRHEGSSTLRVTGHAKIFIFASPAAPGPIEALSREG